MSDRAGNRSEAGRADPDRRRVLITGLSSFWGGRLAEALEADPAIEALVGVDTREPTRELRRTEFVKVSNQHSLLERIVDAARIDTVIDTRLVVDSVPTSAREAHENNVLGTMNILAACAGPSSPVRRFVFKSSAHYYGCEQDDPAFFTEGMQRPHAPRTRIERDIVEAEAAVAEHAAKHRETMVTVLRCANVLGPGVDTSHTRMLRPAADPDGARLRSPLPVRARERRRPGAGARWRSAPSPASSTSRRTASWRYRR